MEKGRTYSPQLTRTPQTPRAKMSLSAPPTPQVGYATPNKSRSPAHHYAGILMQHDSSNSDSSMAYISPAHRTTGTSYGTLQTDISNNCPQTNNHLVVEMTEQTEGTVSGTTLRKSITWIWTIINVVTFTFCTFSLFQPNWLTNADTSAALGLVCYCEQGATISTEQELCQYYERNVLLPSSPSVSWQLAIVLYAVACILLAVSSILTSLCLCASRIAMVNRISFAAGLQQLTAAILLLTTLVAVPVGFDSSEVRDMCGTESGLFNTGNCHIGWSYIIPSACCLLCFALPVLSHYVTYVPKYHYLQ